MDVSAYLEEIVKAAKEVTIQPQTQESSCKAENPTAKYNYIGKLADPTARGEEAIMYKGVSFDSVELTKYELGAIVDAEFPFTFDDYEYINSID